MHFWWHHLERLFLYCIPGYGSSYLSVRLTFSFKELLEMIISPPYITMFYSFTHSIALDNMIFEA
jgi:hypothetical protein